MSDQRYAPPQAPLAEPEQRPRAGGQIDIGEAFREAWAATWANFGLLLGASLLGLIIAIASTVTIVGFFLILPVLGWGWCRFMLNMLDGRGEFQDQFAGFSQYGETLPGMLVLSLLMGLIGLAGQSVQYLGQFTHSGLITVAGVGVSLAWSFMVMPRLAFVWYFLVDQRLAPSEAIRACWDATANQKLICFLLGLVSGLVTIVGFLCLVVGVIPALFVSALMQAAAYRQLVAR